MVIFGLGVTGYANGLSPVLDTLTAVDFVPQPNFLPYLNKGLSKWIDSAGCARLSAEAK